MGVVYKARHLALNRLDALKMIRAGVYSDQAELARFLDEARKLALLSHPNIVPIYTVSDESGRAFFAMEYLEEGTLAAKLNGAPLSAFQAAQLVETLARAIQCAHQQNIIHRDLKPGNILLARSDFTHGIPLGRNSDDSLYYQPKIADFGLAKRLNGEATLNSQSAIVGTPSYMPPEQAQGRLGPGIQPTADVYALGAILYECVIGRPPFLAENSADTLIQVLTSEPVSPRRLQSKLPRDLETICLKCLEKKPRHRYPTAEALADDLRRFLNGEPIKARPATRWEKVWKWARRRPALAAAGLVGLLAAVLLAAGGIWHTVQMGKALQDARDAESHADQERRKAEELERDAVRAAKEARDNAATAQTVAAFLAEIFQAAEASGVPSSGFPSGGKRGADLTAKEILDRGAQRVRTELKKGSAVQAAMLDVLGNVYRSWAEMERAEEFLKEGLAIRQGLFGDEHLETATSFFHLGWLRHDQGDYAEAERLYRKALAIREKLLEKDHPLVAETLFNLGWLIAHQPPDRPSPQRLAEAEDIFRNVLRIRRERLGHDHRDVAFTLIALAAVLYGRDGGSLEALGLVTQAVVILQKQDGPETTGTAIIMYLQAEQARKAKKFDEAVGLHQKVLERARRKVGNRHPITALLLGSLAGVLREKGDLAAAETAIREALDIGRHSPLRWHPQMIEGLNQLADHLFARGDVQEAEKLYREALAIARFRLTKEHRLYQETVAKLTKLLRNQGRQDEAEELAKSLK
jgi:tetratricopeptide (TPR) repeat protein/tRNA A-37 threonylcarbamoyl transferase component Bud32